MDITRLYNIISVLMKDNILLTFNMNAITRTAVKNLEHLIFDSCFMQLELCSRYLIHHQMGHDRPSLHPSVRTAIASL